jgi:hypothetical protein
MWQVLCEILKSLKCCLPDVVDACDSDMLSMEKSFAHGDPASYTADSGGEFLKWTCQKAMF